MFNGNGMLYMLILLLLFSFTGNGISGGENLVLIFTAFALLLQSGTLGGGKCCNTNQ